MDFLLSLSAKAKEKLSKALPDNLNRSVTYADQTLSEEDVSIRFLDASFSKYLLTIYRQSGH